jgi:hypothetical protein
VDLVQELAARLVDQRLLEGVDPPAEGLQDEEIVVDDRVDDRVGQIIGPQPASPGTTGRNSVPG